MVDCLKLDAAEEGRVATFGGDGSLGRPVLAFNVATRGRVVCLRGLGITERFCGEVALANSFTELVEDAKSDGGRMHRDLCGVKTLETPRVGAGEDGRSAKLSIVRSESEGRLLCGNLAVSILANPNDSSPGEASLSSGV